MENNFNKISVFDKDMKKFLVFSKVNFIFGYAKSGKTSSLLKLLDIFSGKDKHHLVNGTQCLPNDYNIVYVNSSDGLNNHLKLNSKSLVRKMIEMNRFSSDFENATTSIQNGLLSAKNEIQLFLSKNLPGSHIKITNEDSIVNFLLDNMSIEIESNSDSESKWNLFSIIDGISNEIQNQTIVFMDDFNKDFDEEMTIQFMNRIQSSNAIFFLTSRRVIPQYLIHNEDCVFAIRDEKLIQMPSVESLVKEELINQDIYRSFEEYMIEAGYIEQSKIPNAFVDKILSDEKSNILRILTSKEPIINYVNIPGKVTICPSNMSEERIYRKIFELLNLR